MTIARSVDGPDFITVAIVIFNDSANETPNTVMSILLYGRKENHDERMNRRFEEDKKDCGNEKTDSRI